MLPFVHVVGSGSQIPYMLQVLDTTSPNLYPKLHEGLKETVVFTGYDPLGGYICPLRMVGFAQVISVKLSRNY